MWERFQEWAWQEVSEVKKAKVAIGLLVSLGAFLGWSAARWWGAQQIELLILQRDTALAGAKIINEQRRFPNDLYWPSVSVAATFATGCVIALWAVNRRNRTVLIKLTEITRLRDDAVEKLALHAAPTTPIVQLFQHTSAGGEFTERVARMFADAGYEVVGGMTNLPQHAKGVWLKGGDRADQAHAKWGLSTLGVEPSVDTAPDKPEHFQVIVGAVQANKALAPSPVAQPKGIASHVANFELSAAGGRGKATLTIRHHGDPTEYQIEGRIVALVEGTTNPAPSVFRAELQPGGEKKAGFEVALNDGEFAHVILADIGEEHGVLGGHTSWLQVRCGKYGNTSVIPNSGAVVEYLVKTKPAPVGGSAEPKRFRVVRDGDFLVVSEVAIGRDAPAALSKPAQVSVLVEPFPGTEATLILRGLNQTPEAMTSVEFVVTNIMCWSDGHQRFVTVPEIHGTGVKFPQEVVLRSKPTLHPGRPEKFGVITVDDNGLLFTSYQREYRTKTKGVWQISYRVTPHKQQAREGVMCIKWESTPAFPNRLSHCDCPKSMIVPN